MTASTRMEKTSDKTRRSISCDDCQIWMKSCLDMFYMWIIVVFTFDVINTPRYGDMARVFSDMLIKRFTRNPTGGNVFADTPLLTTLAMVVVIILCTYTYTSYVLPLIVCGVYMNFPYNQWHHLEFCKAKLVAICSDEDRLMKIGFTLALVTWILIISKLYFLLIILASSTAATGFYFYYQNVILLQQKLDAVRVSNVALRDVHMRVPRPIVNFT
jgi:hypothetical protein